MSSPASVTEVLHHHIRRMSGRDPHEKHRVASSLELLFDLTFATCFAFAATQLTHALAAGEYTTALLGSDSRVSHLLGLVQLLVVRISLRH